MNPPSEPPPPRTPWRSVLHVLAVATFALLALAIVTVGVLHTRRGLTAAVNLTLRLVRPWPGAEFVVANARGGFLSGIEVYGVRIHKQNDLDARIDTLRIQYSLSDLPRRPLRIRSVFLAGVRMTARFPFPGEAPPKPSGKGADLAFDRVELRRGDARLRVPSVGRDSVLELDQVALAGSGIRITKTVAFTIDTLAMWLRAPAPPPATLRIAAAGSFAPGNLHLRSLTVDGDRTKVRGAGMLALPTPAHTGFDGTDLHLTFAPLAGTDLSRFLPALGDPGDVTLDLTARGDASALRTILSARSERGGTAYLQAAVPARQGAAALRTEGHVAGLDLDAILGKNLGGINLTGRWSADLAGPSPARVSGQLTIDLKGTRVRGSPLDRARLDGGFEEGRLAFRLDGAAAGYGLMGSGWVTPLASPRGYEFSGSLSVPPLRTADSTCFYAGTASIRAQGLLPGKSDASAEIAVDSLQSPVLGPGRVDLTFDSGNLAWRSDLSVATGSARAEGSLRLGRIPSYRVRGELRHVDVGRFARGATPCPLSVRFRGEGQGSQLHSIRASAQLDSISVRYGGHEIRDGRATVRLAGGQARIQSRAALDGGSVEGFASIARWIPPRAGTARVAVRDIDLARLTQRKDLPGRLNGDLEGVLKNGSGRIDGRIHCESRESSLHGTITAHGSGKEVRSLDGDAVLDFSGSRIHRVTLDRLLAHLTLNRGELESTLDLRADRDSAGLRLTAEPFENPIRARATGAARSERIAELLGLDSLRAGAQLSFEADGQIPRPGSIRDWTVSTRLTGRARASRGDSAEARVDSILVDGTLTHGVVDLHSLAVRGNVLNADGAGRVVLPGTASPDSSSFQLAGTIGDLETLAPILGLTDLAVVDGRFRMGAAGTAGKMALSAHASLTGPHLNDIWADSVGLDLSGMVRDTTLSDLAAHVQARSLVVRPLRPRDLDATLGWNGTEASAELHSMILGRWPEEIALHVEPRKDGFRGRLDRFVRTRPSGTLALQDPVEFEFGERMSLGNLALLDDGVPRLQARGGMTENGALDFEVHVDSLDLGHLEDLSGLPLGGAVSLNGSLKGTRREPVADATARARLVAGGRKPADWSGELHWAGDTLDLATRFDQTSSNRLALDARLPLAFTLAPKSGAAYVAPAQGSMHARFEATRFDLSWFQPLISPRSARGLKGLVDGTVTAEGDPERPDLSGGLALKNMRVGLPPLGITLEEGTASLDFSGRTVRVGRASIKSGGTLGATGTLTLAERGKQNLDLEVKLDRFVPVNTEQAKAQVDGRIAVTGDLRAPRVHGDFTLRKSTIYAEPGERGNLEPVTLSRRDLLDLQERFGVDVGSAAQHAPGGALADSADLDVTLRVGDNVWVRRHSDPVVALELKGDVRARRQPGRPLDARGTLAIKTGRSNVSFLGRRFEILSANVNLPGPVDSASARLEAFYRPRSDATSSADVDVKATVEIEPSGITTNLRSEPYLDQASLLNYLATGQVEGGLGSGTAYGMAVGSALGAVGGSAGRRLGLDVVEVTTDAYGGQTLGAGSYVNPRVYLGFRQPVVEGKRSGTSSTSSSSSTEFEVEFEAMRNLLFNVQGGSSQYRFVLRPRLGR